jgi:hypothetical protein
MRKSPYAILRSTLRVFFAVALAAFAVPALAQSSDSAQPKRPTEVYVPASDLDAILGTEKRGVLLPRSQFEELLKKAEQNARDTPNIPNGIAVVSADYQGQIVGTQLLLGATIKLNQVVDGWRFLRMPLAGVGLESAALDGRPALLGAKGADRELHLFSNRRGGHTLLLELAIPLAASGGDREAVFRLGDLPVGTLNLEVAANQRLLASGRALERPSPLDKPATYSLPVGGSAEIKLRLTDRSLEQASDRLLFADTTYCASVSYSEANWQGVISLDARGPAVEHLVITVPADLRITSVESTGLNSWKVSAGTPQKPATLELSYRQPFTGKREIRLDAVLSPGANRRWRIEPLKIQGVTAHVGRIQIVYPADLRLRIESATNLRTGKPANNNPPAAPILPLTALPRSETSAPMASPPTVPPSPASLLFDAWNEQFVLTFAVDAKEREVRADLLTAFEVSPSGLQLQLAASLESLNSPVFDVEVTLTAEWTPTTVLIGSQPVEWRELSAEAGTRHLLVTLPNPASPGVRTSLTLSAQKSVSPWPIDEAGIEVALPEIRVLNSAAIAGSYVVRASDDFELTPIDVKGLDPAHLKLERERIGYRYQDTRFSGKLKIARRPARLSAETLIVSRLDRAALRTHLQTAIEARGGGFRRLDVFLPESVSKDVRFQTNPGEVAIADQTVSEPVRGERHWTLVFSRYVQGTVHLHALIESPRGDAKEFRVPEPRLEGVARHTGFIVVQAAPDQQLRLTASGADNQPLPEVDQADLPPLGDKTDDRTVAAYRFVQPDNRVTLAETRYAPLGVARAVCTHCTIQTVVPLTGECQHTAAFVFLASGVQNLQLALPPRADLWATLIDGQPVEVRRGPAGYELPLKPAPNPDAQRVLSVFYSTPAPKEPKASADEVPAVEAADSASARLASDAGLGAKVHFQQAPPEVSVVGSAGTPERMEVLDRKWTLHYPSDLVVEQSLGAFRPELSLLDMSFLGRLVHDLGNVTPTDVGWRLLEFFGVVVVAWLCVRGYSRWGGRGIVTACVAVAVIGCLWLSTLMFTARDQSATYFASAKSAGEAKREPALAAQWNRSVPAGAAPAKPINVHGNLGGVRVQDDVHFFGDTGAPFKSDAKTGNGSPDLDGLPVDQILTGPRLAPPPTAQPADRGRVQGLLSVAIGFEPQQESNNRTFEYIGRESATAQPPQIDVQFESLAGRRVFCGAIVAIVTFLLWMVRRRSWQVKGVLGALGLVLPIALVGVAPTHFEVWLDGIFLGTLCGVAAWLIYELPGALDGWNRRMSSTKPAPGAPLKAAGTAVLLVTLLITPSSTRADDGEPNAPKAPRPVVVPRPEQLGSAVIPYDPDHGPSAADRVLLEQRAFLDLWNRAHPERPLDAHLLPEAFVTEATYKAQVTRQADPGKSGAGAVDRVQITIIGRLALYSRVDRPVSVELPFRDVALKSAKLDGNPAVLIPHPQPKAEPPAFRPYDVAIKTAGMHVLEVELEIPARIAGPSGEFTLHLLPVASGRLSFEVPGGASTVRLNGANAGFRRRSNGGQEWIDVPIASAGDLTIAWQPKQEASSTARSIESVAHTWFALGDAGVETVSRSSLLIRQGGVADLSFTLPANSKLKDIRGTDVAGWKIEGNDPARKLIVSLRRSVTGTTDVELDLFRPLELGESAQPVALVLPAPIDVVRETGAVALTAGPQFDIRSPNLPGATRIEAREFDLSEFGNRADDPMKPGDLIEAAFRYVSHPAPFESTIARRSSQTDVKSLYAVQVGRRKLTLSSQFHVQPSGIGLTRAQFRLPAGFLVLAVEGMPLADWYLTGVAGAKSLIVEFASPQSAPFDLVINGTVAKNPDDAKATLDVPILSATRRAESHLAIWLDGSYQATIGESTDWKSISPDQTPPTMKSLVAAPPHFAFESRRTEPAAVSLNLARAVARLAGDSATIVTVTDTAVFYTVALQWTITQATADSFVLTMPDWLAARLDLADSQTESGAASGRRQTVSTAIGNGRVRWTIELQDPVADQLFLTATAVLPLPKDGKIEAPALGFESEAPTGGDSKPEALATQRHFLVLVNQSTGQLSDAPGNAIESVDRGALPIQLDANLLKQAMLVSRWTRADASASWRLDRPSVRRGAAAFVNLADLVTVIEQRGTWRTQATYRVKNLSRQFLAVEIPDQSEILAVTVQHKPTRAVRATIKGKSYNLIPLPEVSEGDLSFDVQMIVGGRLAGGPLPEGAQFLGDKVPLVAPQVVTWENDADYGIPVARTRWTVWFPKEEQVRVLTSSQDTNLDQADEYTATVFERSALLDEARQLLSVVETGGSGNASQQARSNLQQLNKALDDARTSIASSGDKNPLVSDVERQDAEVRQKLRDLQQAAPKVQEESAGEKMPGRRFTPQAQSAQARDLLTRNERSKDMDSASGKAEKEFGFRANETGVLIDRAQAGKSTRGAGDRKRGQQELESADKPLTQPKEAAELEKQFDAISGKPARLTEGFQKGKGKYGPDRSINGGDKGQPGQPQSTLGLGQFGAPIFSGQRQEQGDMISGFVGGMPPQAGPAAENPQGDQKAASQPTGRPHSPGTLSLVFDIPQEGHKLVFTKAGGDPKLTVELRPRKSLDLLLGALWMLPWLFVLLLAILLFGRGRYAPTARRQLPYGLIAVGLLLFVFLPAPAFWLGLVLVAVGTVQASITRQQPDANP